MEFTETELSDLIKSVEKEFSAHLLAKSEEEAPEKKEEPSKEEPKEEKKEEHKEEPKEESHKEESKEEGEKHEGEKEEHKEVPKEEAHEEEAPEHDEDSHGYDDEDMEHMHKMYSSMSKGELKAHHDCIKKCLDGHKEGAPMAKSEVTEAIEIPSVNLEEVALLKSEFEAVKAEKEKLQKNLDVATEFLTKLVKKTVPASKAITSLEVINKNEASNEDAYKTLSKSEITAKLNKAASNPSLAKSDRDLINAFYCTSNPNIESISHLLK